jgi:2-isopropylmalate synthase
VSKEFKTDGELVKGEITVLYQGEEKTYDVQGNGRLDCVCNAIIAATQKPFTIDSYVEHALEEKSSSKAASYVSIVADGKTYWGTGIHSDIMTSSVKALVSAVNGML